MQVHRHWPGLSMYAVTLLFLLLTLFDPHDLFIWVLETSWVIVGFGLCLWFNSKHIYPTPLLSWSLFIHALILIYGAWYTYELVPLGNRVSDLMGWERNHYDRLGHFVQGLFPAILVREVLQRNEVVNGRAWRECIVFAAVMAFTGLFELIEFAAALLFGDGAAAYLGSQGDVWDAQWDMTMCLIGGVLSILLLQHVHQSQLDALSSTGADRQRVSA